MPTPQIFLMCKHLHIVAEPGAPSDTLPDECALIPLPYMPVHTLTQHCLPHPSLACLPSARVVVSVKGQ